MNGQIQAFLLGFYTTGVSDFLSSDCFSRRRLVAALACSLLLHAIALDFPLFVAPARHQVYGDAAQRPRALSATLRASGRGERTVRPGFSVRRDMLTELLRVVPEDTASASTTVDQAGGYFPPEADFLPIDALTSRPEALAEVQVDATDALANVASGKLILDLWINASGEVVNSSVGASDLPEAVAAAIEAAFRKLRFKPGEFDGRSVGAVMRIEVNYGEEESLVR